MKRKLVDYEVFERIQKDSVSNMARELTSAESVLAKSLGLNEVKLYCYGPQTAIYETNDGSYVHTSYDLKDRFIKFDNIEQIIINEEDEQKASRGTVSKMVEAILENNDSQAAELFKSYISLPNIRRTLKESAFANGKHFNEGRCCPKCKCSKCKCSNKKCFKGDLKMKEINKNQLKSWNTLSENLFNYLSHKTLTPVLKDSSIARDERGNVIAVRIPNESARNEGKILKLTYKNMLDTDVKVLRTKGKNLAENAAFCKAIFDLKRMNNVSDNEKVEESLTDIITNYPSVLYLTQPELCETVKYALETTQATNYDDQTCEFMAEGILRVAHEHYTDRVGRLLRLAGVDKPCEDCDQYKQFQEVMEPFFYHIDETDKLDMQVYVDLYDTMREVYKQAVSDRNVNVKNETASYLNDLAAVIRQEIKPDSELVLSATEFLSQVVETNLEGKDWDVSNSVHHTVSGDHPAMAEKARQPYTPAKDFSGDYGDEAPVSDGKTYRGGLADEMRNRGWSNIGGADIYPDLQNPYVPKPFGDYKIKGEKSVADGTDDATGQFSSSETWPNLENPYVPDSVKPKMNNGKEKDLVEDK